jgi:hypothetical protein
MTVDSNFIDHSCGDKSNWFSTCCVNFQVWNIHGWNHKSLKTQLAYCQLVKKLQSLIWGITIKFMKFMEFHMNAKKSLKLLPSERLSKRSLLVTEMLFMRLCSFLAMVCDAQTDVLHFQSKFKNCEEFVLNLNHKKFRLEKTSKP